MISGPYRTGANSETERSANAYALNRAAYEVLRRGHIPIIGVNLARPIIDVSERDVYEAVMMPLCLELAARCDAVCDWKVLLRARIEKWNVSALAVAWYFRVSTIFRPANCGSWTDRIVVVAATRLTTAMPAGKLAPCRYATPSCSP